MRFLPEFCCTRWDLGLHYNAQSAVLLSISAIYGFYRMRQTFLSKFVFLLAIILMVNALLLYRVILHGPFALAYNKDFYKQTKNLEYLDHLVEKIPKNSTVMTQNNIAVRFAHQQVWLLRKEYQLYGPDYIIIDIRERQNPNNFFATKDALSILKKLKEDDNYILGYQTKEQYIFKKK